ncbi:hypothetical protein HG530_008684 [Fusarium avenaceum]|nr:hypothetical protein HG530_008684 [Fusarium avenaceum]
MNSNQLLNTFSALRFEELLTIYLHSTLVIFFCAILQNSWPKNTDTVASKSSLELGVVFGFELSFKLLQFLRMNIRSHKLTKLAQIRFRILIKSRVLNEFGSSIGDLIHSIQNGAYKLRVCLFQLRNLGDLVCGGFGLSSVYQQQR